MNIPPLFRIKFLASSVGAALIGFLPQTTSAAGFFSLNSEAEFTNNFAASGTAFSWSNGPGVGGVLGRADVVTSANRPLTLNESLTFASGGSFVISTLFYYNHTVFHPGRENGFLATVGILNSQTNYFSRGDTNAFYLDAALVVGAGGVQRKLGLSSKLGGVNTESTLYSTNFSLLTGWYEIRGDFQFTGADQFNLGVSLFGRGVDGTGAPSLISYLTGSAINSDVVSAGSLYAGINGAFQSLAYIDNVSVVPEPNTIMILLASVALLWRGRIKRGS